MRKADYELVALVLRVTLEQRSLTRDTYCELCDRFGIAFAAQNERFNLKIWCSATALPE